MPASQSNPQRLWLSLTVTHHGAWATRYGGVTQTEPFLVVNCAEHTEPHRISNIWRCGIVLKLPHRTWSHGLLGVDRSAASAKSIMSQWTEPLQIWAPWQNTSNNKKLRRCFYSVGSPPVLHRHSAGTSMGMRRHQRFVFFWSHKTVLWVRDVWTSDDANLVK